MLQLTIGFELVAVRLQCWSRYRKERRRERHRCQYRQLPCALCERHGHGCRSDGVSLTSPFLPSIPSLTQDKSFIRPCGMNSPHTHPRATEFLYVVNGQMETGFIEENGARFVVNTVSEGQGTLFPKGSIHYQINLGCEPLTFVAALNNEDPGVSQIAQRCEYPDRAVSQDY